MSASGINQSGLDDGGKETTCGCIPSWMCSKCKQVSSANNAHPHTKICITVFICAIIAYIAVNASLSGTDKKTIATAEIELVDVEAVPFYFMPDDSDDCRVEIIRRWGVITAPQDSTTQWYNALETVLTEQGKPDQ